MREAAEKAHAAMSGGRGDAGDISLFCVGMGVLGDAHEARMLKHVQKAGIKATGYGSTH